MTKPKRKPRPRLRAAKSVKLVPVEKLAEVLPAVEALETLAAKVRRKFKEFFA